MLYAEKTVSLLKVKFVPIKIIDSDSIKFFARQQF